MSRSNAAYWQQRLTSFFKQLDATEARLKAKLVSAAQRELVLLEREIERFYGRYATDQGLTYQQAQQKLRSEELHDYMERARAYRKGGDRSKEALARLNAQYLSTQMTRLELLKAELMFIIIRETGDTELMFTDYLQSTAKQAYLAALFDEATQTLRLKDVQIILRSEWSGANYSQRLWRHADNLGAALQEVLVRGFIRGEHPRVMARWFRKLVESSLANAERLLRTESTFVANQAIKEGYQEIGVAEYEFSAHLDARTSRVCRAHHQKVYPLSAFMPGVNAPPMHPNCRSRIVPAESQLHHYDKYLVDEPKIYFSRSNELVPLSNKWYNGLTKTEKAFIELYTSDGSRQLNKSLRTGELDELGKQMTKYLSQSLRKFTLPHAIVTWRRVSQREWFALQKANQTLDFKSLSLLKEAAESFKTKEQGELVIKFILPKNSKGAYIGKHSAYDNEAEFLLAPGSSYTINKGRGYWEVRVHGKNK